VGVIFYRERKISAVTGIITLVAGNGTTGTSGDGSAATACQFGAGGFGGVGVAGIAIDGSSGNIYIADGTNNKIRVINSSGIINTFAGTGVAGSTGDGSAATAALLNGPRGLALDASGNLYIADAANNKIRKITVSTGIITTIAGTGAAGALGDGAAATAAQLSSPRGVALDASGNVYIADRTNNKIRKVTVSTGIITTVAGTGGGGFTGDGTAATGAQINRPTDLKVDVLGDILFADNVLFNGKDKIYFEKFATCYELALKGRAFKSVEDMKINNETRYTTVTFNPVFDDDMKITGVSCFARDITESRKHLLKIEEQNTALREIAFIESHKVRGPVANIIGLEQLFNYQDLTDPMNEQIIHSMGIVTKQLDNIIKQIVDKSNNIGLQP